MLSFYRQENMFFYRQENIRTRGWVWVVVSIVVNQHIFAFNEIIHYIESEKG